MKPITTILLLMLYPLTATAHHSRAEYVDEREITGTLVDIEWRNPHPGFTIEVGSGAEATRWTVEGWGSLNTFGRAGIAQDRFQLGDTLSVFGLVSEQRERRLLGTHMLLADGTQAILRRDADPHWDEFKTLGGRRNWEAETQAAVVNAAAENRGMFRVWSYPSPEYRTAMHLPLTEYAQAARAQWDPLDNYVVRCEPKGMPASMLTPNPYEFIENRDGTITIRAYEADIVRTIHMGSAADPSTVPPSRQGYSVGNWEDDGKTLVIHTSRIDSPYFGFTGIPLSEDLEVIERYTLSDDQTRMDYRLSATDPMAFTEPATFEYYWLALGEEFGEYDCQVE